MNWAVFRIDEKREDNGTYGPGFQSWVTGTVLTQVYSTAGDPNAIQSTARQKAKELAEQNPGKRYIVVEIFEVMK